MGCSSDGDERMLVYEFMANGTRRLDAALGVRVHAPHEQVRRVQLWRGAAGVALREERGGVRRAADPGGRRGGRGARLRLRGVPRCRLRVRP